MEVQKGNDMGLMDLQKCEVPFYTKVIGQNSRKTTINDYFINFKIKGQDKVVTITGLLR